MNKYNTHSDKMKQQILIKNIVETINPNFHTLFNQHTINIAINNKVNHSGKHNKYLDFHKVHETLGDFIKLEKVLLNSGIIKKQLPEFTLEPTRTIVKFII